MTTKTTMKPVVGDVGVAVSKLCGTHAGDSMTVSVKNDVGGHSNLPEGRYLVRITKAWEDYETGRRLIGELMFQKDIETSRKAGTTGRAADEYAKYGSAHVEQVKKAAAEFDPKTVYFHGDDFTTDPKTKIVNGAIVTEIEVDTDKTNDELERESYDYTLKGVKTFRGRDGYGLNATLCRGKKKVAFIMDAGNGGMIDIDWVDQMHGESKEEALFNIFIEEQKLKADDTKKDEYGHTERFYFNAEHWINITVDKMTNDKKFRKLCKTTLVFQVGDKIGCDEFQCIKGLQHRAYVEKKYAGQQLRFMNDELKG